MHKGIKKFSCKFCGKTSGYEGDIRRHISFVHKGEAVEYTCKICKKVYNKFADLKKHRKTEHGRGIRLNKSDEKSKDQEILRMYNGESKIKGLSVVVNRLDEKKLKNLLPTKTEIEPIKIGHKEYECPFCQKIMDRYFMMVRHIRIHTGEKPFACKYCNYRAAQKNDLKTHCKRKHPTDNKELDYKPNDIFNSNIENHLNVILETKNENVEEEEEIEEDFYIPDVENLDENFEYHKIDHWPCNQCGKVLTSKYNLKDHIEVVHEGIKKFSCKYCEQNFGYENDLRRHIQAIHKDKDVEYKCKKCEMSFNVFTDLLKHRKSEHKGIKNVPTKIQQSDGIELKPNDLLNSKTDENEPIKIGPYKYECPFCKKIMCRRDPMKRHIRIHTGEKPFACEYCNYRAAQKYDLKTHCQRKHPTEFEETEQKQKGFVNTKTYEPKNENIEEEEDDFNFSEAIGHQIAEKEFKQENLHPSKDENSSDINLEFINEPTKKEEIKDYPEMENLDGKSENPKKGNWSCDQCGKVLSSRYNLNDHIDVVHKGIKKFSCKFCELKFGYESVLRVHVRGVHKDIESLDYKCKKCDMAFNEFSELKKHRKSAHETIGSFACEKCDKVFSVEAKLKHHNDFIHKGIRRFKCTQCIKAFGDKKGLQNHIMSVHEGMKFLCDKCDRSYSYEHALKQHIKTVHEGIKPKKEFKHQCDQCPYVTFGKSRHAGFFKLLQNSYEIIS